MPREGRLSEQSDYHHCTKVVLTRTNGLLTTYKHRYGRTSRVSLCDYM